MAEQQAAFDDSPILIPSTQNEPGSPPVMVLEDDDEPVVGFSVQIDADDYFQQFPYARVGDYAHVVRELPQYIQGTSPIDGQLLPLLTEWLRDVPDPSVDIHGFYVSKAVFWDDFGILVSKVLSRRYNFGEHFNDDVQTANIFYRFLSAYVRLCSFLFLADAHLISQPRAEEIYALPLLSQKHIRFLYNIIRTDKTPIFHVLHKEYDADIRTMSIRLHKDFLFENGAQNLLILADKMFHQVPPNVHNTMATFTSQLISALGWSIFELPGVDTYIDRSKYHRGVLSFFQKFSEDLRDPSNSVDAGVARDLIQYYSTLVHELCQWNNEIATELVDQLLDLDDPDSPTNSSPVVEHTSFSSNDYRQDHTCFPALVANAWKFKALRKYIVKGNMNQRVMSIATMDAALVDIWREFSNIDPSCRHPVMQFLADFLLKGQVVDYIVSVDSHPQLISRSGNIVGFLVVTHRWSDYQADAIWRTVSNNPDPRVVSATMTMLRGIIGLMKPADQLYFCIKLHELPIERYTLDNLRFLRELSGKLKENLDRIDFDERGATARPWNVSIRLVRDTAPCRESDRGSMDLFAEADELFRFWLNVISAAERQTIFYDCAQHIANHTAKATGSMRVIFFLVCSLSADADVFLQHNQDLVRAVLEEIPYFVKTESEATPYPFQVQALHCRLEFLRVMIYHGQSGIPMELYTTLWDHVVGKHALSNEARDLAWTQFLEAIRISPDNDFCAQLVTSYIPTMDASNYTPRLFELVASYSFPVTRQQVQTDFGESTLLQIPGATLLWPMVLSSPAGTIEGRAARLLASRYVQIVESDGIMLTEVETAHIALVEQCMQELRSARQMQSKSQSVASAAISEPNEKHQDNAESRFGRILLFQKLLIEFIRKKPEFNRGRRVDSKVDAMDMDIPTGDVLSVRYQCGNDRQYVTMNPDHSLDDLYRRLCHATGFTKVNLFAKGQRLKLSEKGQTKLSNLDFGGQIIVQRAEGAGMTEPVSGPIGGTSVFESTIIKHFDELFSWMDSEDNMSRLLFDFLSFFPARGTFADSVMNGTVSSKDLFPPGKVYQARYAAQALQVRLREQIRNSTMSEIFLSNAIRHLDNALLNDNLTSDAAPEIQELQLAAVLVNVLLEFLRERPSPEVSAGYFSDATSLVNRLMNILSAALERSEFAIIAQDSYATILEASLHSRSIWDAFIQQPNMNRVHGALILAHPNQVFREDIARKIASICGGDLPSTCPITKAEIASRFWDILSVILPEVVEYPGQSRQFFEIADHVFRTNDEYDRNEKLLRSFLTQWSTLLLSHEHKPFPGREETDDVVFGLTKLILCCILSIKSFKKPVNAGSLMEQVFRKYLFVHRSSEQSTDKGLLPILESHTRQELYDLMLGLAEDRSTYSTLLELAEEVELDKSGPVFAATLVERSAEIRSSTGYVGLYNPRAICYMNSLLTQLFMNVNFRQFVLNLEVKDAGGSQRLLCETQRLFAQMQSSYRKSVDPRDFAACVKSLDKTPIDITIQMDADEFYNLLFDQWEAQLIKKEDKHQFRSFYGGQTLNQIKSKECEHVSERAEPFFAVQCDVQGKLNLQESLQAYVQGDVMEGDNKYKCESCGGKFVDAVKRTCFKDVPDNLIFHLKRFEFDLNDFSRRKIYDHFAFPETLDISHYKVDHLANPTQPRKEDLFNLVGVLVHTGTCEAGHYYSYTRERPCPDGMVKPTWIEFNDSEVVPFNPAEIADRAFGGMMEGEEFSRQVKQFSAYMLFYQRKTAIEEDQRHWIASTSGRSPQITVPDAFAEETMNNNERLIREYCLFDPVHAKFLRQVHSTSRTVNQGVCSDDHEQETRALHVLLAHLGHTAWRHQTADVFLDLMPQLRRSLLSCTACCDIALRWLAVDEYALTNIIVKCTHPRIRSQVRTLLIESLKYLREKEPSLYGMETADSDNDTNTSASAEGLLDTFAYRLRTTADETRESIRGWEDYYLMVTQIAEMGHLETAVLLNHGFLNFCLKIFGAHSSQALRIEAGDFTRILEKRRGIYNRLIGCVWKLLSQTDLRLPTITESQARDRLATLDREQQKFPLAKREKTLLVWWSDELKALAIIDKILELFDDTKIEQFYPGDIFKWMLESSDEVVQANICRTITEGLTLDPPFCDAYVRVALPFCEVCPKSDNIMKVIAAISKAIGSNSRAADDRPPGGGVVLQFFAGLLRAQNDVLFAQKHPYAFHQHLMYRSRIYGTALLCHFDDLVRKATLNFFQQLFDNDEDYPPETLRVKYNSMRELLAEMIHRFVYEKDLGRHQSFLVPLVETCRLLVQHIFALSQSPEPELLEYQNPDDAALIVQYQQEVETRLRMGPLGGGTPLSTGETYDQSDFGSESDEAHDLLDI